MKKMSGKELREAFLAFFEGKNHQILPSAPLVPEDDPSLLFINAGMAPFKPYFSGEKKPTHKRVATSQKCIRTNDIENVGKTKRHQTFFEMLGNFSFADYFKEKAIPWAWEFVTEVLELDEKRLWVTIYYEDEESFKIWNEKVGVSSDRIIRMGKEENFWQIGTGPCGPCSEIHYDREIEKGTKNIDIAEEGDRFLEIWNLVFTQYDYTEEGEYLTLPDKNIDTGMGLERVASILQDVDSNFETDLLWPIIEYVKKDSGHNYDENQIIKTSYRVIADHIRTITLAISDGALPSNEGRGYVVRRLLRRAVRYGDKLGYDSPFLYKIVPVVEDIMNDVDPELTDKREHLQNIIQSEEERFFATLDQGLDILKEMIARLKKKEQNVLSGKNAFKLYDTYGFPLELTSDILQENGYKVDQDGFEKEMKKQRERARRAREDIGFNSEQKEIYSQIRDRVNKTEFTGYRRLVQNTKVAALIRDGKEVDKLEEGEKGEVVLEYTPFYAESGGQVADYGKLTGENVKAKVYDVQEKMDLFYHQVRVNDGVLKKNAEVKAKVESEKRKSTARNHSATHLLHRALREVLGEHVDQSGSLVAPDRLRFDFSHYSSLNSKEIERVENIVNEKILDNLTVETLETTMDKARDMGAVALFNEKYGKKVRVVKMGDYTIELCGGTHVEFTGEIGLFKIVNEGSVAAGIRRIEAVTGLNALEYIREQNSLIENSARKLKAEPEKLPEQIENLQEEQKKLEKEMESLKDKLAYSRSDDLIKKVEKINDISVIIEEVEDLDVDGLRSLSDELQEELNSGIIVLASRTGEKVVFVCSVSSDLIEEGYDAGEIINKTARITGGGGGGRSDMAQAGGSKPEKLNKALQETKNIITNIK
ncbi:MAG: alanine--tRNA ligase [Halanaerobiales bacterium]